MKENCVEGQQTTCLKINDHVLIKKKKKKIIWEKIREEDNQKMGVSHYIYNINWSTQK